MNSGVGSSGFADPERQQSGLPTPSVVELADLGGGERADRGARRERRFAFHGGSYSRLSHLMSAARWSLIAAVATMVVWGTNFAFVKYVLAEHRASVRSSSCAS